VASDAAGRGDYLVRNVIGHDPESGAMAVGDLVAEGELLRLHVRDASTAREDLELLLAPQAFDSPARGGPRLLVQRARPAALRRAGRRHRAGAGGARRRAGRGLLLRR